MATWSELELADPALAAFGRERLTGVVAYHATLRPDGSPRVHPVSPWIATGLLMISCRGHSPKVDEWSRDARYALHTSQPGEDHGGETGEFMVSGWMEQVGATHPAAVQCPYAGPDLSYDPAFYACHVEEAVGTTFDGDTPIYRRWRP